MSADFLMDAAGKVPLLTAEQEIQLARNLQCWLQHPDYPDAPPRIKRAGIRARDRMVSANLRLVVFIARKYQNRLKDDVYDISDVIQDGNLGLIRAAEGFDPARGYRFSTYAYWWVRQSINRGLETRQRLIRAPHQLMQTFARTGKVTRELGNKLGRMPTHEELAEGLDVSLEELRYYLQVHGKPASLDAPMASAPEICLLESIADPQSLDRNDYESVELGLLRKQMHQYMKYLRDDEQVLLNLRYGLDGGTPKSFTEMHKELGMSREGIRQKLYAAQNRLKRMCCFAKGPDGRPQQAVQDWKQQARHDALPSPVGRSAPALSSRWS